MPYKKFDPLPSSDLVISHEPKPMISGNDLEAIAHYFAISPKFDVRISGGRLLVTRRRPLVPRRRLFPLLIPQARAIVATGAKGLTLSVRPDPIAIFMVLMLLGALAGEFFTDRVIYP